MRKWLLATVILVLKVSNLAGESRPEAEATQRVNAFSGLQLQGDRIDRRLQIAAPAAQSVNAPLIVKQFEETSYYLSDIVLLDANTGWAVGQPHWNQAERRYKGTIVKTTNGGRTWTAQEAGVGESFRGVHFVNANQGWVVGTNGTILHTTDGGAHWTRQPVATTAEFRGVVFTDLNNGWATASWAVHYDEFSGDFDDWQAGIWRTSDGGRTWTEQRVPANASILNRIDFVDSQSGWAVGAKLTGYDSMGPTHASVVYHTTDGGRTWTEQYSPELPMTFTAVDFVDANTGWVAGFITNSGVRGGSMYHTVDGGRTWDRQKPGPDPVRTEIGGFGEGLWDVKFLDKERGYAVGTDFGAGAWGPPVWRTIDGGATWIIIRMASHDGEGLFGVAVVGNQVVAVGDHDYLANSTAPWDPGKTQFSCFNNDCLFTQTYLNTHYAFQDVFFSDESHGCAVGTKTFKVELWGQVILCTDDGGSAWTVRYEHAPRPNALFSYHRLESVHFSDRNNGWAVGKAEMIYTTTYEYHGAILRTTDGGLTWKEQGAEICGTSDCELSVVQFLDSQNGWALDRNGVSPGELVRLARTADSGAHWKWVDTGVSLTIGVGFAFVQGSMLFTDAQHGYVAGWNGVIRTEDGGAHWTKSTISCGSPVCYLSGYGMAFPASRTGWIAGEGLYRTVDGGATWSKTDLKFSREMQDIQFLDANTGWMAGDYGVLFYTADGGNQWRILDTGTSVSLRGLHFPSVRRGWIVGDYGAILSYASDRIPAGKPAIFAAVNGAGFLPGIASAAWISLFGENLAPAARVWGWPDFNGDKLPTQLDGVGIKVNGRPAYVSYISPAQLNILVPDDAAEGPVFIDVSTGQGQSDPFLAQKAKYSPALFRFPAKGGNFAIAQGTDGKWIGYYGLMYALGLTGQMRDATPGEIVTLYGTGFGPANPPAPTDTLVTQPALLATPVTFRVGRIRADVVWAGLIGSGLYQFNIRIPNDAPNGGNTIVAEIGGFSSQGDSVITVRKR